MNILIVNSSDKSIEQVEIIDTILKELEVKVKYLDLTKQQYSMTAVELMIEKCDGVILVSYIEWVGVGYYMQKFLDECWQLHNQSVFENKYCLTVNTSNIETPFEEALQLSKSWTKLGGYQPEQLLGVINQSNDIHSKDKIKLVIEKKIEDFYRVVNSKKSYLPIFSTSTIPNKISSEVVKENLDETDQSELQMITKFFKNKINNNINELSFDKVKEILVKRYNKITAQDISTSFQFVVNNLEQYYIFINVSYGELKIKNSKENSYVEITCNDETLKQLLEGKIKLYNAFLLGKLKVKGHVETLSIFDKVFPIN